MRDVLNAYISMYSSVKKQQLSVRIVVVRWGVSRLARPNPELPILGKAETQLTSYD